MEEKFRNAIARQIERRKLRPVDVAEKAGIGYPYLYRILAGEQCPTLRTAEKIARALNLKVDIRAK